MENITINGRIEFCDDRYKKYDREFTATLQDSAAFEYGNKTSVYIKFGTMANGEHAEPVYLDTRYDRTIKRNEADFKKWVQKYFAENYGKHILTIY